MFTVIFFKGSESGLDIQVKDIMDTWTLQMGYPVVTVNRHNRDMTAWQERFLYNPRANVTEEFTSPYRLGILHMV